MCERSSLNSRVSCSDSDRGYGNGTAISSRMRVGRALITDPDEAAEQSILLARDRVAIAVDGTRVTVRADTLCLHGDRADAVEFARALHSLLREEGVQLRAPGSAA